MKYRKSADTKNQNKYSVTASISSSHKNHNQYDSSNVPHTAIRRGDIYYADLNPVVGSEQGGIRPVLILQNDIGNRYSTTTIVSPLTARLDKPCLPTHVMIPVSVGLAEPSVVLLEQIKTIDKSRSLEYVGHVPDDGHVPNKNRATTVNVPIDNSINQQINNALAISLGMGGL